MQTRHLSFHLSALVENAKASRAVSEGNISIRKAKVYLIPSLYIF